jgi:hypothetical protein
MNQTLHILEKDTRHLWWEILGVLVLTIGYAVGDYFRTLPGKEQVTLSLGFAILLVIGWYNLIALLVLDESLADEVQFWVTRPYTWQRLLAAKALFIILFINLPLLLAQCAILEATGFTPTSYLPGLLWKQLGLTVVFLLPAFALATVSRGLVQFATFTIAFAICWIAMVVAANLLQEIRGDWVQQLATGLLMAAAALTVLLLQYARRTTYPSRCILVCAAALLVASGALGRWTYALVFPERATGSSDTSSIALDFENDERWRPNKSANFVASGSLKNLRPPRPDMVEINLPIQVTGLEEGMDLDASGLSVSLNGPGGRAWRFSGDPWHGSSTTAFVRREGSLFIMALLVDQAFFDEVKSQTLDCRISIDLALFRDVSATVLPNPGSTWVPGLGYCSNRGSSSLVCLSPMRRPSRIVFRDLEPNHCIPVGFLNSYWQTWRAGDWYTPFPAEFGLSPLVLFQVQKPLGPSYCPGAGLALVPQRSSAHFRRNLEISDLRLADYAVH